MQTVVNSIFSPAELFMLWMMFLGSCYAIALAIRAAKKAATRENGKKLAIGTAKVAGKTAGKIAAKAAWQMVKNRTGL